MEKAAIGIIGGSGLYQVSGIEVLAEFEVSTPFGTPSDKLSLVEIEGTRALFLPRHGKGHRHNPTTVPVRANIYAMKKLGVKHLISISAVGSLKLEVKPGEILFPDQVIDKTKSRVNTFFDDIAVHAVFSDPFCSELSTLLHKKSVEIGLPVHYGGTYVCMEGPLFSTKAESALHRSWGASVIGMTCLPEAKLAREAEICYATACMVTDYDVWHTSETVDIEMILENLAKNVENVKNLLSASVPLIKELPAECACQNALENAVLTDLSLIPVESERKYALFLDKYLNKK